MKRYPKYKDSGIEWIGEIPEHWQDVQLKRCLRSVSNGTTANQVDHITDFPVSRIETISSGIIDTNKVGYLDKEDIEDKFILKKGDILLSHINSLKYVGNCAIYISEDLLIHGMNLLRLQSNQKTIPKFLLYYLKSHILKNQIQANSKHAINQVSLPSSSLKGLRIALPTNPEQQTIANYLDRKTHLIDTLIEKKQKLIALLKEQRTAIINLAVTKGLDPNVKLKDSGIEWLGAIPEHWIVAGMTKYIKSIVDYRGRTPEKIEVGVFLVTARNIKEGKIDYSLSQEYISQSEYERIMTRGIPQIGDVLFTTEAPLGEVANVDDENIALAQRIIKFRGNPDYLDDYFLKYWILSDAFQNDLQSYATGSTALGIKASKLNFLRIALPPLTEQKKIVSYLDDISFEFVQLIDKHNKSIDHLKEYRTTLISEVVTGKIDVRDSEEQEVRHS